MDCLTVRDLTVRRGSTLIVYGLSLPIRSGRPFWIVGPNGAGKTSLLRVLAGLDPPAEGSVRRTPRDGSPFLYFHSEFALPGWSTVGAWDRLADTVAPDRGAATTLRPDVSPRRWIRRLSTGERKRILLDALLRVPGHLLLDEPYQHLSRQARTDLTTLLRRRSRSCLVVVATNEECARETGDGALRLHGGYAEQLGVA